MLCLWPGVRPGRCLTSTMLLISLFVACSGGTGNLPESPSIATAGSARLVSQRTGSITAPLLAGRTTHAGNVPSRNLTERS